MPENFFLRGTKINNGVLSNAVIILDCLFVFCVFDGLYVFCGHFADEFDVGAGESCAIQIFVSAAVNVVNVAVNDFHGDAGGADACAARRVCDRAD